MKTFHAALGLTSFLVIAGATSMAPTISSAQTVERNYVACNQYRECWRVRQIYAYGEQMPITYYDSNWYVAHQNDRNIRWLDDPADDRGYYREGRWYPDPAARAVQGGVVGASLGAAIGCLVTLPVGCAPGAGVGAAIGGGTGVAV